MILQYLNNDGYAIPKDKRPTFIRVQERRGGRISAQYIQCPEINGLLWIGNCERCKNFGGHVKFEGIKCNIKKNN